MITIRDWMLKSAAISKNSKSFYEILEIYICGLTRMELVPTFSTFVNNNFRSVATVLNLNFFCGKVVDAACKIRLKRKGANKLSQIISWLINGCHHLFRHFYLHLHNILTSLPPHHSYRNAMKLICISNLNKKLKLKFNIIHDRQLNCLITSKYLHLFQEKKRLTELRQTKCLA